MYLKEKFLVIFSMFLILFIVVVPIVFANSPFVIGEEKAGGYQYTVIKEQNTFLGKLVIKTTYLLSYRIRIIAKVWSVLELQLKILTWKYLK